MNFQKWLQKQYADKPYRPKGKVKKKLYKQYCNEMTASNLVNDPTTGNFTTLSRLSSICSSIENIAKMQFNGTVKPNKKRRN